MTNNLIRVQLRWSGFGEIGTIGWHLGGVPSAVSNAQLSDLLDAIDTAWASDETPSSYTTFAGLLATGQTIDQVSAYAYAASAEPATAQAVKALSHAGTDSSEGSPLQVAWVASLRTGIPGRSYRGRQYFPGYALRVATNTGLAGNTVTDNNNTLAINMGLEVKESAQSVLGSNDIFWGVFSRARNTIDPVVECRVDNRPDVQRRRANSLQPNHTSAASVGPNP